MAEYYLGGRRYETTPYDDLVRDWDMRAVYGRTLRECADGLRARHRKRDRAALVRRWIKEAASLREAGELSDWEYCNTIANALEECAAHLSVALHIR